MPPPTKLKKQYVNIVSQNTRGLSEDKEEELINSWKERKVFACRMPSRNVASGRADAVGK